MVRPSARRTRSTRPPPSIASSRPREEFDPVLAVRSRRAADGRPEDVLERHGHPFEEGHLHPELPRRGGGLRADPARADHHEPASGVEYLAQMPGCPPGCAGQDAVQVGARQGQPARLGAGGEEQAVPGKTLPVGQRDGAIGGVDGRGGGRRSAARSRGPRRRRRRARRPCRARPRRAGGPWRGAGARRGARAPGRRGPGARRTPPPAASPPPWRRRGRLPRSRCPGALSRRLLRSGAQGGEDSAGQRRRAASLGELDERVQVVPGVAARSSARWGGTPPGRATAGASRRSGPPACACGDPERSCR